MSFSNEPSRIEVAAPSQLPCPRCGHRPGANDELPPAALYHPWTVRNREALFEYVRSLSKETHEWLLAFYVDNELNLLATETIAKGGLDGVPVDFGAILCRGRALGAKGFLLVHNHPSGDATPSNTDIALTQRLRRTSAEFELPLLDHFVVAGGDMLQVGYW